MNRLSLAPVTINEIDPPELIAAAHAAGFGSVDLRVLGAPGAAPNCATTTMRGAAMP